MNKDVLSYSKWSKVFHWLIALIVIFLLSLSFFLSDVPADYKGTAYMIHKSLGLSVLALMFCRIIALYVQGKPDLPLSVSKWQRVVAHSIQYSLYLLLLAMPLTGWLMASAADKMPRYFGLFTVPPLIGPNLSLAKWWSEAHTIIAWLLIACIFLHIGAALKHYFVDKDGVFERMWVVRKKII